MGNQLYNCVCIFVLTLSLQILLSPICNAKVVNDTCRIKQDISVQATLKPERSAKYAKANQKINLEYGRDDGNLEEDGTNVRQKREVSKRSANNANVEFHRLNAAKSIGYDNIATRVGLQRLNEQSDYAGEADEEMTRREHERDGKTNDFVRVLRDVNADLDKYTDQDERSSLYDDYEAKDVAKRGVLGGPEDYEEMDENMPMIEDTVAVREQGSMPIDKAEKRETRSDTRVKRDQAVSQPLDKIESNPSDLFETDGTRIVNDASQPIDIAQLRESKISTVDPYPFEVSRIQPLKSNNEASIPNDVFNAKGSDSSDAVSRPSDAFKIEEATNVIASPKDDDTNAEYEIRAEEQIQRKIDSIKDEIQRDIEAQRRFTDIQENNARFDELQDQEREDEEGQSFESDSIEKRQSIAKRSIREIAAREEQRGEPQRRSIEFGKSDAIKERLPCKDVKKRSTTNRESSGQNPSKGFFKKKRDRVRQTILVHKDHHRTRKRHSRSYASPSKRTDVKLRNVLSIDQDLNSDLYANDRMAPLPLASEDENNEGERSPAATAGRPNSLASLTGSSQELSPRLAMEYKEAFGGLQSEPGSALARFKRIKRVLDRTDEKISSLI